MGFENRAINNVDRGRNPGEHPVIVHMHEKAVEVLEDDSFNPSNFINHYGAETVTRDLEAVARKKEKFQTSEIKKVADVFEALVLTHVELSNWFGPNATTRSTSEYDDIFNHVDLITEFNEPDSTKYLALGIDVTFGSVSMGKKFAQIKQEIDKDDLAQIKYFESHGFKGSLRQLPRVVIGVEKDTIIQLASLWMRKQNAELANHHTKFILLEEIERQLRTFLLYAQSKGSQGAVRSYTQTLATIKTIRELNESTPRSSEQQRAVTNDRVYNDILKNLGQFQRSSRA